MADKTLEQLHADERAYLQRKTDKVPGSGKKVETVRKEHLERVDEQNAKDEKLFAKQRAKQEERNKEFRKENKLPETEETTLIIANKPVKVADTTLAAENPPTEPPIATAEVSKTIPEPPKEQPNP